MTRMPSKLYAGAWLAAAAAFLSGPPTLRAQKEQIVWSDREKPIVEQMRKLRGLPDDERVSTTKRLAVQLRQLPAGPNKEILAESLANLVTEGDPGPETLQEVAITLAQALREQPAAAGKDPTTMPYVTLAQLVRYEHVQVSLDDPRFAAAMAKLEADDRLRQSVDFTLSDLAGKPWTLKELRGCVVLSISGPPGVHPAARRCPIWKRCISGSDRKGWSFWPSPTKKPAKCGRSWRSTMSAIRSFSTRAER